MYIPVKILVSDVNLHPYVAGGGADGFRQVGFWRTMLATSARTLCNSRNEGLKFV